MKLMVCVLCLAATLEVALAQRDYYSAEGTEGRAVQAGVPEGLSYRVLASLMEHGHGFSIQTDHGEERSSTDESKEPVKSVVIHKAIPYPVAHFFPSQIDKQNAYPVKVQHYQVDKPYEVTIYKPYPVPVDRPVPYTVEKQVPYPEKQVSYTVDKQVPYTLKHVPYTLEKHVPYTLEKHVPYTLEKQVPYTLEKQVPYTLEKQVPYSVEKHVPYTAKVTVKAPTKSSVGQQPYELPKHFAVHVPVPKTYNKARELKGELRAEQSEEQAVQAHGLGLAGLGEDKYAKLEASLLAGHKRGSFSYSYRH